MIASPLPPNLLCLQAPPAVPSIIGGFRLDGKRLQLLLVGYFEGAKLLFAGKVHQGLNPANRRSLLKALQRLQVKNCQFANLLTSKSGYWGEGVTTEEMVDYVWLRTQAVAEIKFAEWTTGDVLRHAEFVTLRQDRDPKDVVRETAI